MLLLSVKSSRTFGRRRRFGEPSEGPVIPFGAMVEYHPISSRDLENSSDMHQSRENLERSFSGRRHRGIGKHAWTRQQAILEESMQKKY